MRKRLLIGAASLAAICVTGVAAAGGLSGSAPPATATALPAGADTAQAEPTAALPSFSSCMALLAYAKSNALRSRRPLRPGRHRAPVAAVPAAEAADGEDAGQGGPTPDDFSGTNVQEEGVDEPDIVKTDGKSSSRSRRASSTPSTSAARYPCWSAPLPLGERLRAAATARGRSAARDGDDGFFFEPLPAMEGDVMPGGAPSTTLTEVDVSDPAAMRIVQTLTLDANYVSARLVGSVARLVVSSTPTNLPFVYPETGKRRDIARGQASQQSRDPRLDPRQLASRLQGARRGNRQDDDEVAARVPSRFVTPPSSPGSACSAS